MNRLLPLGLAALALALGAPAARGQATEPGAATRRATVTSSQLSQTAAGRLTAITGVTATTGAEAPVALFSLLQRPGEPGRFAYLILVRRRAGDAAWPRARDQKSSARGGGDVAISSQLLFGDGEDAPRMGFAYERQGRVETLRLDDEARDLTQGRLFLLDLTAEAPTVRQLDVELPTLDELPARDERLLLELTDEILRELKEQSQDVEAFLGAE